MMGSTPRSKFIQLDPRNRRHPAEVRRVQAMQLALREFSTVIDKIGSFSEFNAIDRWLPLVLEAAIPFLDSFIDVQRDINAFMKEHTDVATVGERELLPRVELLLDDKLATLIEVLEDGLAPIVGAPFKPASVVSDVIKPLKNHVVDGVDLQARGEFVGDAVVDEGDGAGGCAHE